MLTAAQIDVLRDASGQLLDPVVEFLIEDIARRVSEAGQLTSTAAYQVWRAQNLGMSQKKLKKELQKKLDVSEKELEKLLKQAAETGYNFDLSRLPTSQGIPFAANSSIQQIVNAAVKQAKKDLTNITRTMGFVSSDGKARTLTKAYKKACDDAFMRTVTGAQDYNSAIRDALKGLYEKGIVTIDHHSRRHFTVEAAVRQNIMGGMGLMQKQISEQNHDDLGCNGWEISAHAASAPDHEPFQGRQYTDKQYKELNNSLLRPIGTLNCGHAEFPIIIGVHSPQYTEEELEDLRQQNEKGITVDGRHYTGYEATQHQRALERAIRGQKRKILIDKTVEDPDKLQTDQIKLVRLRDEYARFSKAADLPTQYARAEAAGFTWKEGKEAESVARKKSQALSIFKINSEYKQENGTFDFGLAREDYEMFLTSVPEKNRMYLQQSFESVSYYEGKKNSSPFIYEPEDDAIWYDPGNRSFWDYTFVEANTHELSHRVDNFFARSVDSEAFAHAITSASESVLKNPEKFVDYCWNHPDNPFVSDVVDALCEGKSNLPAGHGSKYWTGGRGKLHKSKEIFANIFSMEALSKSEDLAFLKESFPEMYMEYLKLL